MQSKNNTCIIINIWIKCDKASINNKQFQSCLHFCSELWYMKEKYRLNFSQKHSLSIGSKDKRHIHMYILQIRLCRRSVMWCNSLDGYQVVDSYWYDQVPSYWKKTKNKYLKASYLAIWNCLRFVWAHALAPRLHARFSIEGVGGLIKWTTWPCM